LEEQGVITGFAFYITAQKHYQDYLKEFTAKKNSILDILSHDLAGPLGMITNLADALQTDLQSHQD
jgi:two-component system sensor histidine kinase VicK